MPQSPYTPMGSRVDLAAIDHEVLAFWREHDVFARSLARTAGGAPWVFYEGPPTANGEPGTHHVEARVFKDVFPRFKTMKGYSVPRRGGWDCHGLPVELAVEQELGLSGKRDIERLGIEEFNARCRESVGRYVGEFERLTERVGYWVDLSDAYWTMSPEYIDSVWWALRRIHDQDLLVQDHRVAPYCPRCGTALSDHEVAQGYETVTDPSVYVRLPLTGPVAGVDGAALLVWTTTPWTLVSNTAVAVHSEVTYVLARDGDETLVVAEPLLAEILGEDATILARLPGVELAGLAYRPPFNLVDIPDAHVVITAGYVTTDEGTGLVHQAPAFGADDLAATRAHAMPVVNPIEPDGRFAPGLDLIGGTFFTDANAALVADLRERGLLYAHREYEHSYPHCWRCHTPLMYYAQLSWYIRTTARRDALLRENERTNWYPDHIKHGRFGDWLANNVDWSLSRSRYWGTPLPLWRCADGHVTAVGSRAELGELAGADLSGLDPHRPYIDEVTIACRECGRPAERVSEVADAWFDSGAMPFAGLGYPHLPGSVQALERSYPAQFICEAIDQTRGWFYTLMAIGTLVFDRSSYENVVCLGHIMAEDGRKMSKHLGNVLEPMPLMERHGADAVRWFMLSAGSPWANRRVGHGPLDEIVRKTLLTYVHTAGFFTLYASLSDWAPERAGPPGQRPVLDRWVLAELDHVAATVDTGLEDFDTAGAGRALAGFVDDLSNWYVRRCRARFWRGEPDALATLAWCLDTLTRLLAPFIPFVTEHVWQHAVRPGFPDAPDSVHLASWPAAAPGGHGGALRDDMALARQVVEAGRSARKDSGVRTRQPLARALVGLAAGRRLPDELVGEIADELNVRELTGLAESGEVLDVTVKPNFRALGKRFGPRTPQVAAAIAGADPAGLAAALGRDAEAKVTVADELVAVGADEVAISEVPRRGWAVAEQGGVTVALDTTITPELRRAGLAREVIRRIQGARRDAGLDVADRIRLGVSAGGETARAVREHRDELADAVLATQVTEGSLGGEPAASGSDSELGLRFWLARA